MQTDLTNGSVLKNIALFSLPFFLSYFLQTLYGLADLFIIGQFDGVDSITGCFHWFTDHAYDNCHDCRFIYGRYYMYCSGCRN